MNIVKMAGGVSLLLVTFLLAGFCQIEPAFSARLVEETQATGGQQGEGPKKPARTLTPSRSRDRVEGAQAPEPSRVPAQGQGEQMEDKGAKSRPSPSDRITINFDNADIRTVIKFISELTGKNFVVDDKVKGTVTIISPTDITVDEAYHVFLSVLEMKGFTVVEAGKVFKIVPSAEARYRDIETLRPGEIGKVGREERMVTQLIPLTYASANDLKGILTPLVSKDSQIVAYVPTNTLIITDYASNIKRLEGLIKELDVESKEEIITVHQLQYAPATFLATELLALMDRVTSGAMSRTAPSTPAPRTPTPTPGAPTPPPAAGQQEQQAALSVSKLVPDERTNSLIIIASEAETKKILELVEKLDVPLPPGRKKINVYYLENAKAEEVLQVLSQLSGRGAGTVGYGTTALGTTRTGAGGLGGGLGTGGLGTGGLGTTSGLTSSLGASTTAGLGTTTRAAGAVGTGTGLFSTGIERGPRAAILGEDVVVVADRGTNAIIVMAPPEHYETIKELIEKLDVWRPQVLVEALIAEVSLTKTKSLGIEWQFAKELKSDSAVEGGTGPVDIDKLFSTAGQLALGVFKGPAIIGGKELFDVKALLRALQTAQDVNILSTPHILTLNNEEAEIVVAQNIPFLKSQTGTAESTTPGTTTPVTAVLQTFEFKDVGIILRITPQISKGKYVRLNIFQEVSDVGAQERLTTTPTTFKRQAKTVVVVEDGQTVVIGGLIQDSNRESVTGVPCLASVPLLGNLFRSQSIGPNEKRNLLIFITPRIINTPEMMAEITERKVKERESDAKKFHEWKGKDLEETLEMILR